MPKKDSPISKFKAALTQLPTKDYRTYSYGDCSPIISYWNSLSNSEKKKVVSDRYWNNYPMWSSRKNTNGKIYSSAISSLVKHIAIKGGNDFTIIKNHSSGVFAIFTQKHLEASDLIKTSKRLMNSSDVRVRSRCANYLPISSLKPMIKDNSYSIRNTAMKRIGMTSFYKEFLSVKDKKFPWMKHKCVVLAKTSEVRDFMNSCEKESPLYKTAARELFKRASVEDALFLLDDIKDLPNSSELTAIKFGV